MFTIGNDELLELDTIGETIKCDMCGQRHKVEYGKRRVSEDVWEDSKLLAFYKCGDTAYLCGIDGKKLRSKPSRGAARHDKQLQTVKNNYET